MATENNSIEESITELLDLLNKTQTNEAKQLIYFGEATLRKDLIELLTGAQIISEPVEHKLNNIFVMGRRYAHFANARNPRGYLFILLKEAEKRGDLK